ncbi:hypothetical protein GPECTOR_1g400 [Gonium pectorale]|uniref:PAS domain-containing protein n=1 Tax=Gonium pectorale TaxID=33097 RepID=A0A150H3P6_GONPE|nr:hypothetical protein GPECTOR_1g400 [Gonium pectorale]|eukprot:KXZ56448.1 hypothetical protein GPECTOR_1g400 [Gonium pectorale]
MQRASVVKSGEASVDLVSYVEYQRQHRLVMRAHRAALVAIRNFWQLLLHHTVAFTSLAKALHRIEKSVSVAEGVYRSALVRYPASPKLLRGYGKFLETVKNNPWRAAKYFSEAEKLLDQQQQDEATMAVMGAGEAGIGGGMAGSGAHLLHRVDERVNIVFLINSAGIIQMANKNAHSLLGFAKGELDGKNINTIMPPPFSQRHNRYIRQYIQSGRERVISSVNTVVALHKARYVLPVKLAVSKVSGATEDSIFLGVLEPLPIDPAEAKLYLMPSGVVTAMDQAFAEWTGYDMGDILGKDIGGLVTDAEPIKQLLPLFDPVELAKVSRARNATPSSNGYDPSMNGGSLHSPQGAAASGMFGIGMGLGGGGGGAAGFPPAGSPLAAAAAAIAPQHLAAVQFLHKYSRTVGCAVTMHRLGIGPVEGMVELTLRRNDPPHLLAITGPSGRVRYIASELARALGTSPSALYRQPLGEIMPQPWGTLHSAWIKSMGSGAAAAAAASAQGMGHSVLPGSCRSGITMVLGSSLRMQNYYRLAISSNDDSGEVQHMMEAIPSRREKALAERRLVLTVDADGVVTEVDDGPAWLYGFEPSQLRGRSLADVVTTLRPEAPQAAGEGAGPDADVSVTELLSLLISKAMMQSGVSWRVGVTVPTDEAELEALGPMREAVLAKRTTAALMEIEVSLDTSALGKAEGRAAGGDGAGVTTLADLQPSSGGGAAAASGSGLAALPAPVVPGTSGRVMSSSMPGCLGNGAAADGGGGPSERRVSRGSSFWLQARMSSASGAPPASPSGAAAALAVMQRMGSEGTISTGKRASVGGGSSTHGAVGGGGGGESQGGRGLVFKTTVRRNSWIAMEGPGGGIMVVSGAAVEGGATAVLRQSMRTRASLGTLRAAASGALPASPMPAAARASAVATAQLSPSVSHDASPLFPSGQVPAAAAAAPSPLVTVVSQRPHHSDGTGNLGATTGGGGGAATKQQPMLRRHSSTFVMESGGAGPTVSLGGEVQCAAVPSEALDASSAAVGATKADDDVGGKPSAKDCAAATADGGGDSSGNCSDPVPAAEAAAAEVTVCPRPVMEANSEPHSPTPGEAKDAAQPGPAGSPLLPPPASVAEEAGLAAEPTELELMPGEPVGDHSRRGATLDGGEEEEGAERRSPRPRDAVAAIPTLPDAPDFTGPDVPAADPAATAADAADPAATASDADDAVQGHVRSLALGEASDAAACPEPDGRDVALSPVDASSAATAADAGGGAAANGAGADIRAPGDDIMQLFAGRRAASAPQMFDELDSGRDLLAKLLSLKAYRSAANGPLDTASSFGGDALLPLLPSPLGTGSFSAITAAVAAGGSTSGRPKSPLRRALANDPYNPMRWPAGAAADTAVAEDVGSVELPPSVADDARVVVIRVSLWRADLLTPVVELDSAGAIVGMVGEELAPPGLLFGVPTSAMHSRQLHSFLELQDRSVAGLFQDPGTARRGGLKTTAKEANKIGTLREVTGRHIDGQRLELSLQAVVKESAPSRTYVVLKPRRPSRGSRAALLHSVRDVGLGLELRQDLVGADELAAAAVVLPQPPALQPSPPAAAAGFPEAPTGPPPLSPPRVRNHASLRRSFESAAESIDRHPLMAKVGDADDVLPLARHSPPATPTAAPVPPASPFVEAWAVPGVRAFVAPPAHMLGDVDAEVRLAHMPHGGGGGAAPVGEHPFARIT